MNRFWGKQRRNILVSHLSPHPTPHTKTKIINGFSR
ncbi:hypothetical protein CY0110_16897 [Crocosphaera chwakensis CCY0110]|uniref:Uncharacterized protein n=1 Tax=Crocosphaera chwakensis CCY0110 TaxID=391612 RepID=A3II61_9CHRO|nr:hypothetical protein CY0110_16897 [Crocosphaera chwakensis CCY0110]